MPYLDQRGNTHFKTLKKFAFNYDSSVIIKPEDIKRQNGLRFWPHTLDFAPNYTCPTCPSRAFCSDNSVNCSLSSIWVVPLHYLNVEGKNPCPMLIKDDIADNRLETKNCVPKNELNETILFDQLIDNFKRHYRTNKAPFVINIELNWFEKYGDMLTNALIKFINELTDIKNAIAVKNDIYFVNIARIIEWIEYPTPLNVIAGKWLWDCDGVNYDYDEECEAIRKLRESSEELEEIRKKNKTIKLELQAETLFRNGILSGVIAVFIISIVFTILYDKYN